MIIYLCLLSVSFVAYFSWRSERARNENVGDEYREFDAENPDCQQEFAEDADGGKSNRSPLMHIDPIFKHNP